MKSTPHVTVSIYRAVVGNEFYSIALKPELLGDLMRMGPPPHRGWQVEEIVRTVPSVAGELVGQAPEQHINWSCPFCGHEHSTDLDPTETNPTVWYCPRRGKSDTEIVLIEW